MTEQAAYRICVEEKFKTAREKSQKEDKENKRRFKSLAKKKKEKKVKRPSKNLFSGTCDESGMSHNPVIPWFI